jgi:predicted 2-oxoglutarate/Fe(II)-dependent dioxygenase YbiX
MLSIPLLTAEQCDQVLALGDSAPARIASTERTYQSQKEKLVWMKSSLAFIELEDWLLPILQRAIDEGAAAFGYATRPELHVCTQRCRPRVARYDVGQRFSCHVDVPDPKSQFPPPEIEWIAASVQLDSGDTYEGGELLVDEPGVPYPGHTASRRRGDAAVFKAHRGHEVTLVTAGARRALVFWGNIAMRPDVSPDAAPAFADRHHLFGKDRSRVLALSEALKD